MAGDNLIYEVYERRLATQIDKDAIPSHVGVILDGNRRWARAMGIGTQAGHQKGADKISEFLSWAEDAGVQIVTLWLLSTDNLQRAPQELAPLLDIIARAVEGLASAHKWRLRLVGTVDVLPHDISERITRAVASTADVDGLHVNVAIGYGGRQEIADAVREFLRKQARAGRTIDDVAASLTVEDIAAHLYTAGQPDPELVIRTSGEQRLSGFMLWQSVHSEFYFCEVNWPAFRRIDFLRALRDYGKRERRLGK
ncbi:isoprenyl transferase [Actinomyces vulturis]|uniref:isoprenyl transferase n=1 Tax=Actinomyces vulturis TaxID=1857645 RepID=UPI00082C8475|nr:isoprenyl transferase [Actinomyces vulturis]